MKVTFKQAWNRILRTIKDPQDRARCRLWGPKYGIKIVCWEGRKN